MKIFTADRSNTTNHNSVIFPLFVLVHAGLYLIILLFLGSCVKPVVNNNEKTETEIKAEEKKPDFITWSGAYPAVILQTGEYPLWFQLTDNGLVHIEAIEDAVNSSPFVPWPYAVYICSLKEKNGEIIMVVNRDGFFKFAPNGGATPGFALYRFSGGDFWHQYTVGGFVFYNEQPAAILYLDDRFLSADIPPPNPRVWSFNMNSNTTFALEIPSFKLFPEEDGWNIDTIRLADDGFYYYRAAVRNKSQQKVQMFRTANLEKTGEEISAGVFFNSAPRQKEVFHASLPLLPEDFVYTGMGKIGGSLFASWEEQKDFSIGAAGFVVIRE